MQSWVLVGKEPTNVSQGRRLRMTGHAFEAWWLPPHVTWRFVAIHPNGRKTWHKSLVAAEALLFFLWEV
jgi:hypothetical protein